MRKGRNKLRQDFPEQRVALGLLGMIYYPFNEKQGP